VVGSSIILRAGEHSKIRPTGTFFGLQQLGCQLMWAGMPDMRWENVGYFHISYIFGIPPFHSR
jgi:hypothetical protein